MTVRFKPCDGGGITEWLGIGFTGLGFGLRPSSQIINFCTGLIYFRVKLNCMVIF